MNAPTSNPPDDFLTVARRLALLDEATVRQLRNAEQNSEVGADQLALRQGLLDAAQVDIVETLRHPNDSVPGFEILGLIGQGGMGIVFRARQKSLDRIVAVKTIRVGQMHDHTVLARFEQEALAVAKLRHPNIVAAYDLGRHQGRLYFVMELVDGVDAERLVETEGALDEAVAWGLLRQAAAGLSHAAASGIVHRDIKPANLLIVEPPAGFELRGGLKMVKITDFGLAFLSRDRETKTRLTSANVTIGSPHYIAPEQLEGDSFDYRVDIYSLGATAYHMLAGEPPFNLKNLTQIVAQKLATESIEMRAKFPHVSAASAELVRRMMHRDPARRICGYPELLAKIDELTAGLTTPTVSSRKPSALAATMVIRSDPTPGQLAKSALRPQSVGRRLINRRRFLIAGGGAVGAAAPAAGAWRLASPRRQMPTRTLAPAGLDVNLFDGLSLNGWRAQSGGWAVKRNSEGGRVISGTFGTLSRQLREGAREPKTPLSHYRISVVMQLQGATAAEIDFGQSSADAASAERYAVQLGAEGAALGRRKGDDGLFFPMTNRRPLSRGPSEAYTIVVERQPGWWWASLDDSPLGAVPIRASSEASEFLLRADGGEAWFSDVLLQSLGPAKAGG